MGSCQLEPIMAVRGFEDSVLTGSRVASPLYADLSRCLLPIPPASIVLTHGDVRQANIMVDVGEDGDWRVVGLLGWEAAGFYPEYWGCVKMTNNLTPRDRFDWCNFLPETISMRRFPIQWLVSICDSHPGWSV